MRLQRSFRKIELPCSDGDEQPPCRMLISRTTALVPGHALVRTVRRSLIDVLDPPVFLLYRDCAFEPRGTYSRQEGGGINVELQVDRPGGVCYLMHFAATRSESERLLGV